MLVGRWVLVEGVSVATSPTLIDSVASGSLHNANADPDAPPPTLHPDFKLIMTSRDTNMHYPPEVSRLGGLNAKLRFVYVLILGMCAMSTCHARSALASL